MTYRISLLDKAPVPEGVTVPTAVADAVALAGRAEELGYYRYWFAEHHGVASLASTAPEALAAFVLARTSRIRVGTGGVMLQHYAPYKVAETFNVLAALAPGRVDLGVGRAPGGMPQSTRALRGSHAEFAEKLRELDGFVTGSLPDGHEFAGIAAMPPAGVSPERILLGASVESAEVAARLGWTYCYAGHFDGDSAKIDRVFDTYRAVAGRPPLLSVIAFAAASDEEASRLVGGYRMLRVRLPDGQSVNLPDLDSAREFARQAGAATFETEEIAPHVIAGSGPTVRAELDRLAERHGIEEFVIDNPVPGFAERKASIEFLADTASSANPPRLAGAARG